MFEVTGRCFHSQDFLNNRQKWLVDMGIFLQCKSKHWYVTTACAYIKAAAVHYSKLYTFIMAKFFSHSVTLVLIEIITSQMTNVSLRLFKRKKKKNQRNQSHLFMRGPLESHKTTPLKLFRFFRLFDLLSASGRVITPAIFLPIKDESSNFWHVASKHGLHAWKRKRKGHAEKVLLRWRQ